MLSDWHNTPLDLITRTVWWCANATALSQRPSRGVLMLVLVPRAHASQCVHVPPPHWSYWEIVDFEALSATLSAGNLVEVLNFVFTVFDEALEVGKMGDQCNPHCNTRRNIHNVTPECETRIFYPRKPPL